MNREDFERLKLQSESCIDPYEAIASIWPHIFPNGQTVHISFGLAIIKIAAILGKKIDVDIETDSIIIKRIKSEM